jgi:hypothetical protein
MACAAAVGGSRIEPATPWDPHGMVDDLHRDEWPVRGVSQHSGGPHYGEWS